MVFARGEKQAAIFPFVLAPLRRGPLILAARWSYVTVRTSSERVFGLGDPKIFARLRLWGSQDGPMTMRLEGAARLPTAQPKLFPFASGGQEIELTGSLGTHGGFDLGLGRIWSEPPSGSGIRRNEVPHATHAWILWSRSLAGWAGTARIDELWMQGGTRRSLVEASLTYRSAPGLHVGLVLGFETGAKRERVLDQVAMLRFDTALGRTDPERQSEAVRP